MEYLPLCQYFLIEAQPFHEKALKAFCARHESASFILAAAGDASGEIYFEATDPYGGQASYTPYASNCIRVPMTTIDHEVSSRILKAPYLIKLDTHGFELPILKGAFNTLAETEVIVIECYNFKIAHECLLFYEICGYLAGYGFRCIDLVDPLYRPYDDSFWQVDMIFIRNNRSEFKYLRYK
jgi:FkbM family methyltransferase